MEQTMVTYNQSLPETNTLECFSNDGISYLQIKSTGEIVCNTTDFPNMLPSDFAKAFIKDLEFMTKNLYESGRAAMRKEMIAWIETELPKSGTIGIHQLKAKFGVDK